MPLSKAPAPRKLVHTREYRFQGYEREDGLFDIEGHIVDTKPYSFDNKFRGRVDAGEPIHEMWLRTTLDLDMTIQAIEAVTDNGPYRVCPEITPNFQKAVGLTIGKEAGMCRRRFGTVGIVLENRLAGSHPGLLLVRIAPIGKIGRGGDAYDAR